MKRLSNFCSIFLFPFIVICFVYTIYFYLPMRPNQLKIGTTYMTMNNDFYKVINDEIAKEVNSRGDILYTRDPALDAGKQGQQIEQFIAEGVDMIIINPVDAESSQLLKSLKKARDAGIQIVVVDSQLSDSSFVDTTIVSDNYRAGVLCAQHLMAHQDTARILLLEHRSAVAAVDRIQGFLDTIDGHPAYQVVAREDALGQTEIAMPTVAKLIDSGLDFDTVMALNDRVAIGALAAIESRNYQQGKSIYGVDGSPDMKFLLTNSETIQATVAQTPIQIGHEAIQSAYDLAAGKTLAKEHIIPVELVTQETLVNYDIAGWQ